MRGSLPEIQRTDSSYLGRNYWQQHIVQFSRRMTSYDYVYDPRFEGHTCKGAVQYCHGMFARLTQLKDSIRANVDTAIASAELSSDAETDRLYIGVVHRFQGVDIEERGHDRTGEKITSMQAARDSTMDLLKLEDMSGRCLICFEGDDGTDLLVDGMIVGLVGRRSIMGAMERMDPRHKHDIGRIHTRAAHLVLPGFAPIVQISTRPRISVAFLSGLHLQKPMCARELDALRLACSTICVHNPPVARVIIAGNSIGQYSAPEKATLTLECIATMLPAICIDVMPGDEDPCPKWLPQPPLSRGWTKPNAAVPSGRIFLRSNPYSACIAGLRVIGTSGQPLKSIQGQHGGDPIKQLRHSLQYRHIAVTTPNTLQSVPFEEKDPFVLTETPHIYFSGCAPCASTSTIQVDGTSQCTVVTIPNFRQQISATVQIISL